MVAGKAVCQLGGVLICLVVHWNRQESHGHAWNPAGWACPRASDRRLQAPFNSTLLSPMPPHAMYSDGAAHPAAASRLPPNSPLAAARPRVGSACLFAASRGADLHD